MSLGNLSNLSGLGNRNPFGQVQLTQVPGEGTDIADTLSYGAMGALGGAATGAMIGSIIPGVGTLLGAGIGAVVGGLFGGSNGHKIYQGQKSTAISAQQFEMSQQGVIQQAQGFIHNGFPGMGNLNGGLL